METIPWSELAKKLAIQFQRLTDRARKVFRLADQEARRFEHNYVGPEHMLLGLLKEGTGVGSMVLKQLGIDPRKVRLEIEMIMPAGSERTMGRVPITVQGANVIELAIEEAINLKFNYIGTEHILLGLLRQNEGIIPIVFAKVGLNLESARAKVKELLGIE